MNDAVLVVNAVQTTLLLVFGWLLVDLRARIMRLENGHMKWNGDNRRKDGSA